MTALAFADSASHFGLPSAFRASLEAFAAATWALEAEFDRLEAQSSWRSMPDREDLDELADLVSARLDHHFQALSSGLQNLAADEIDTARAICRTAVGSVFDRSELLHRMFAKPLGYPGDYEMMNMIYREHASGSGLLGQAVSRYATRMPEGCAVRNRVAYLSDKIVAAVSQRDRPGRVRVLSVASGPALELQTLFSRDRSLVEHLEIVLLDQDGGALSHARDRLDAVTGNAAKVTYVRRDIREIIKAGLDQSPFDLIYSAGLFDYFSNPTARAAAGRLAPLLAPEGVLAIGNFASGGPSRALMELVLDWRLTYRTAGELELLYSGLGGHVRVESEPVGINLFAIVGPGRV